MRTIWVAVRGINYTDRATREVGKNIDELIKAQQRLRQHAVIMLSAGAMWLTMAGLISTGINQIIASTAEGRRALNSLSRATNEAMKALSEAFLKTMGPTISLLTNFFRYIGQHKEIASLIAVLGSLGVSLLIIKGISMILPAVWDLVIQRMTLMGIVSVGTANTMTGAFIRLQAAMGPIIMGFMLGSALASAFGKNAWAIAGAITGLTVVFALLATQLWSAAAALSILTFGIAAAAGAAAIALASQNVPSYQVGTEYVSRTQMAIVHEGEKIVPSQDRETSFSNGQSSSAPYPVRSFIFNFTGPINTKADKEELKPLILKVVRDATDNKV